MKAVRRSNYLLPGLLLIGSAQYFITEYIAASAWRAARYDWANNYISDLGVPECLTTQLDRVVCSPAHVVMNTGFITQGLIVLISFYLLRSLFAGRSKWIVAILAVLHGFGLIVVGLFPGSVAEALGGDSFRMMMHSIGALLAIVCGSLLVINAAHALKSSSRPFALWSYLLGGTGLVATVAFGFGQSFGLGIGTIERIAVNPTVIWMISLGVFYLIHTMRMRR